MAELTDLLRVCADGVPVVDAGPLTVVTPPDERSVGVLAFTGRTVVCADVSVSWVRAELGDVDLGVALSPRFLGLLAAMTCRRVAGIDATLVGMGIGRRRGDNLVELADVDHPRLRRAHAHRVEVRAWTCPGGLVVLGRGVAGRWEVAVETEPAVRGFGLGRTLFATALGLVPRGEPVWAQIAPANSASLRAALAGGYRPVGAEALLVPPTEDTGSGSTGAEDRHTDPTDWFFVADQPESD